MNTAPFEAVNQALKSGTAGPSFTSSLLEEIFINRNTLPGQKDVIRETGSTLYTGGADTTVNVLHAFFLAMVLFPEARRKAQEELDKVVGYNRLPEYEDKAYLTCINALCKEDDAFKGYFIPAGTIVVGNTWTLLHDEAKYGADIDKFYRERFLSPGIKGENVDAAFGFGRRICPGRFFANNSLYIAIVSILSVFDIFPARGSTGNVIPVEAAFDSGFLSHPMPFKCTISPRSDPAKGLILQES